MHKKTGSSVSLKDIIMGKEKVNESESLSSTEGRTQKSLKKTKSSTNLAGLLKKKSKRNLQDESKSQANN